MLDKEYFVLRVLYLLTYLLTYLWKSTQGRYVMIWIQIRDISEMCMCFESYNFGQNSIDNNPNLSSNQLSTVMALLIYVICVVKS